MHLIITLETETSGNQAQRRLDEGSLSIGRDDRSDWTLPDPSKLISRQHCLIERRRDGFWLTDQSSNGTYLNGAAEPVGDRPARLNDGDYVKLGANVLRFRIEDSRDHEVDTTDPFAFDFAAAPSEDASTTADEPARKSKDPLSVSGIISTSWLDKDESERQTSPPLPPAPPPKASGDFFEDFVPPQKEHYNPPGRKAAEVDEPALADNQSEPLAEISHDPFGAAQDAEMRLKPSDVLKSEPAPQPSDALRAFLEGAGIADAVLSENEPPTSVLRRLGENYAVMAEGMRQLLDARAAVKSEAGLEQTRIGGNGNNPLKTAVRTDEAVLALVTHKGPGYLPPRAAIEAALADLRNHEIAMLDGLEAALKALLKRLSPTSLEQQLRNESSFRALMSGGRNAMYWRLLKERYADIAERSEQRFLGDFNREFARAYQRRSNSL